MRISIIDLKNYAQYPTTFEKGREYYRSGFVNLRECDSMRVAADVSGSSGNFYSVEFSLAPDTDFGKMVINHWNCTCPAHASDPDGFCKHIIAAALAYNDASSNPAAVTGKRPAPAAVTTSSLRKLLLKRAAEPRITAQNRKLRLEATFELTADGCRLSFRLGYDRLYVIRSLKDFCALMAEGGELQYGKNLTVVHTVSAFREEDRPLLRFLLDEHDYAANSAGMSYYGYAPDRERYLYLRPAQIDRLIECWPGDAMRVSEPAKSSSTDLPVVRSNPTLSASLIEEREGQYQLRFPDSFRHYDGSRRSIVIKSGTVYFTDEQFTSQVLPVVIAAADNIGRLQVSADDMPLFASVLLPKLEDLTRFSSSVDLTRYEAPPLQAQLYIDILEDTKLSARLVFSYGSVSFDAFGEKAAGENHVGDYIAEECARQVVCECFAGSQLLGNAFIRALDEDFLFDFSTIWRERLEQYVTIFCDDSLRNVTIRRPEKVSIGLHLESDLLMMDVTIGEDERCELAGILNSLNAKKRYFRMKDGTFLSLEGNSLSELTVISEGLGLTSEDIASNHITMPAYRAMYLDAAVKESHSIDFVRSTGFRQLIRDLRDVADSDYDLPEQLRGTLRSYQTTGYRWLRTLAGHGFGGILADDMGLGKTLQVLSVLSATHGDGCSIVVCPSSLVLNWVSEANRFVPELEVIAVIGPAPLRAEMIGQLAKDADLLVTSYDSLKRDIDLYEGFEFQYIVADEAQYMKNYNTQNARAVKALNGRHRFALTGTPVENTLAELWSIFDFILPGYLFRYAQFRDRFEQPIIRDGDDDAAQNLRRLTAPFILRRLKRDVLTELPEKTETLLEAVMEPSQKKVYTANAALARDELLAQIASGVSSRIQILALLTRLRQICCDPTLVYENYEGSSAKLDMCIELIEQCVAGGHKLLLFSQFTSMLARIEQRLTSLGIRYYILTGKTRPADRIDMVNAFNGDDTPVFLISLKAGGTGLNLTGADVVIHYDPWWNISAQNQATDRAHRIGQKRSVQIYKLILKDTVEERILALQKSKAELVDKIIEADGDALSTMSSEDLLELLS